jgi:sarcosine oxidase / L-pipecolate oxidase
MAATSPIAPDSTILIIGAGIFGASTALHLVRSYPTIKIKLIDREPFPCQLAASWDWNKIIRAEYTDIFYMKLALEAKKLWETDPLWKPFYHQSGGVWIQDSDLAGVIERNYRELGMSADVETHEIEEAKGLMGGLFRDAEFEGIEKILVSKTTGWAEAGKALKATIEQAVSEGVSYLQGSVTSLAFDESSGDCVGVKTAAEETIRADKVIMCTGAGTGRLLADSAPKRKELHAGGRFIAAGMCTALMTPEPEACRRFKDVPIVLHERLNYEGRGQYHSKLISQPPYSSSSRWLYPSNPRRQLQMVGRYHVLKLHHPRIHRRNHVNAPNWPLSRTVGRTSAIPPRDAAREGSHFRLEA